MSRIRNFFGGVGALVMLVLLLPELVPFFSYVSGLVGGVPGSLMLVAAPVVFLAVLYGLWTTSRRDSERPRFR